MMDANSQWNRNFIVSLTDSSLNDEKNKFSTRLPIEDEKEVLSFFEQIKPKKEIPFLDEEKCSVALDINANLSEEVISGMSNDSGNFLDEKKCYTALDINANLREELVSGMSNDPEYPKNEALLQLDPCSVKTELLLDVKPQKTEDTAEELSFQFSICDVRTELLDDVKPPDSAFTSEYDIKKEEFFYEDLEEDDEEAFYDEERYKVESGWEEPITPPDYSNVDLSTFATPIISPKKSSISIVNTKRKPRIKNVDEFGSWRTVNYVQRYCYKCKTKKKDYKQLSKSKKCQKCSNPLIYICTKCKKKAYLHYQTFLFHWRACKLKPTASDILDAVVMYHCSNCDFKTLRETSMVSHMMKTRHHSRDVSEMTYNEKASGCTVVENKLAFSKLVKRFCFTCKMIVTNVNSTYNNEQCWRCDEQLIFTCTKCGILYNSAPSMRYHLGTECFPNLYTCNNCPYIANYWPLMMNHLRSWHTERPKFYCAHCSFKTKYKPTLIKHLTKKHEGAMIKLCCEICYDFRTYDKLQLKNHIAQVHFF